MLRASSSFPILFLSPWPGTRAEQIGIFMNSCALGSFDCLASARQRHAHTSKRDEAGPCTFSKQQRRDLFGAKKSCLSKSALSVLFDTFCAATGSRGWQRGMPGAPYWTSCVCPCLRPRLDVCSEEIPRCRLGRPIDFELWLAWHRIRLCNTGPQTSATSDRQYKTEVARLRDL